MSFSCISIRGDLVINRKSRQKNIPEKYQSILRDIKNDCFLPSLDLVYELSSNGRIEFIFEYRLGTITVYFDISSGLFSYTKSVCDKYDLILNESLNILYPRDFPRFIADQIEVVRKFN